MRNQSADAAFFCTGLTLRASMEASGFFTTCRGYCQAVPVIY